MQPENWIKRRERDGSHMTSISPNKDVNSIVYRLQAPIIEEVTVISIVRKCTVTGCHGKELIGQSVQPATD